jgi:MFS family permease
MAEHLYVGIITVVLPVIASSLGLSMARAGLLVSTRSLVAGFSNIPSGMLADMTGRRSLALGICLVLLGSSSMLMSFAPDYLTLMLFMALGAVGAGGFHPQSLSILSSAYREKRALALGVHDSSGNLGEILGPLTIGTVLTYTTWRGTLQIWAIPGLVIGLVYALFCSEVNASTLSRTGFSRSLRQDILTNRPVLIIFIISVFRTMGQTALLAFLPLYMNLELKFSTGVLGAYVSILFLFAALAPPLSGWLSDRVGRKPMLVSGLAISGIAIVAVPHLTPGIPLFVGLAVVGTALWAVRPVIFAAAMEVASPRVAIVADSYGLGIALAFVGIFPLLASMTALGLLASARA